MLSKSVQEHFRDKVIWITGASSGIGRALTIELSRYECQIYISARSKEQLQRTVELCYHNNVFPIEGDLSTKSTNQQIVSSISKSAGHLDIAILNAGSCEYVDINQFDSELFRRQIENNFMSMVYGIEAVLPLLKKSNNAQLVGMSSTAAYLGLPRAEAYGATKAAIRNMFAALRVSLQKLNISVSVICPGFVKTELTDKNDFEMPALIESNVAAEYILKGISGYQQEIHFPKRFSWTLKLIASLPNSLLTWLIKKGVAR